MIRAVVLAAGRSQRMGADKLLLPWKGGVVIAGIVYELLAGGVSSILVVGRENNLALRRAVGGGPVGYVANPDETSDMLGSLRCGLRALPPECATALVALGDQPGISAALVSLLIQARERTNAGIVLPIHAGHRGHPVLIQRRYFGELLNDYDGVGLRGFLGVHANEIHAVEVADRESLRDMDTPEEYADLLKRQRGN